MDPFWTPFWERFGPQDRRIRPWKPPLSRPTGLRSSKKPPRGLQGLPGTPSGPPGTSLRDPRTSKRTPRTPPRDRPEASQEPLVPHPQEPLAQHSQARRNARERLNPAQRLGRASRLRYQHECFSDLQLCNANGICNAFCICILHLQASALRDIEA